MSIATLERSLEPFPRYRGPVVGIAAGLTLALGLGLVALGWVAALLFGAIVVSILVVKYPRVGFYALVATVIVVEGASGLPLVAEADPIYNGLDNLVQPGLPLSPLEIWISLAILGTVFQGQSLRLRVGDMFWPLLFFTFGVAVGFARGVSLGGDFITAFHEVRPLIYLLPMYFLAVNLIREPAHFRHLTVIVVASVLVMAAGALWIHFTQVRPGEFRGILDLGFAHENAIFAGFLVVMAAAMAVWGKGFGPRTILLIPGILALAAILIMKRRVGVIAVDAGILLLCLMLLRNNWRVFLLAMPVLAVIGIIYLGVYWNATGGLGQGARAFRTVIGQEQASEDVSSKEYRDIEAFNVEQNIRWQPFWGSGFGRPYAWPLPLPDLTSFWPFQRFIPHNTVLWTWMKGGIMTFTLTLALFSFAMMRGLALARKPFDPLLRAWAVVSAASVLMVFLFAWQDLGLASLRTMVIFGFCLGIITVLGRMPEPEKDGGARESAARKAVAVRRRSHRFAGI